MTTATLFDPPAAASGPAFTAEQRAAVADRSGSRLLAANAGSGKTAVMVERFVEAVLDDGVPVGAILALTFTEKAAGELRERVRRRFGELGRDDLARDAEGAWVGTIHGFCARVLRSHPLAIGLDPRFEVLDELAAQRLAGAAFERALDAFVAERGDAAVDLAAAYGAALRDMILRTSAALRSRGQSQPRIVIPPPAPVPDPAGLAVARDAAARHLGSAAPGIRVAEGLAALGACADAIGALAPGRVPLPGELDAAKLGSGAAVLKEDPCVDYRAAWEGYRQACADHHARAHLMLVDGLLGRFGAVYADAKRARAAVDFEDLELGVRDLFDAEPGLRARWAERFALIMVDEFQDTNRLQLDVLEALERANLFAVGDEFQSIYGFRHADVTIFRDRRAALGPEGTRTLRANFRSDEELLDVLNGAFAPQFGPSFAPLVAGLPAGPRVAAASDELRLFDPDAGVPPVELLVTATTGWDDDPTEVEALGLAGLAEQPWRRAEARAVAHRLREEVDEGRREGDIVVLVRATASLRILEQALEEEGLPTYVVGGRGYWAQEQVRDGLAYLRALANPLDEEALLGVLASPFAGASADALVLMTAAGRGAGGAWAALRAAFAPDPREGGPPAGDALPVGPVNGEPPAGDALPVGPEDGESPARDAWPAALPAAERERLARFAALFAAERDHAQRLAAEVLLERALTATGYDLAVLARPDGERRLANLRKLMRLSREYERAEGRDLRGFLAFAATQELEAAREGEAPLEGEGLNAIRLMTIHRAKGLEFPVVCVADTGREGARGRDALLVGHDGAAGLRLAVVGTGKSVPALEFERLSAELAAAEAEEERRLFYVAMTRARERLIVSGGIDTARRPAPRPGGAPIAWIAPAFLADAPAAVLGDGTRVAIVDGRWEGRPARVRASLLTPGHAARVLPADRRRGTPGGTAMPASASVAPAGPTPARLPTDLPTVPTAAPPGQRPAADLKTMPTAAPPGQRLPTDLAAVPAADPVGPCLPADLPAAAPAPAPALRLAPARLSYSSLGDYARCPYRFYLRRVLHLPDVSAPPAPPPAAATAAAAAEAEALDPRVRGSLAHVLLEDLDFRRPIPPRRAAVVELAEAWGVRPTVEEVDDVIALVAAFAESPLCARLAAAGRGGVRREAPFAFALEDSPAAPMLTGIVDVLATEPGGGALIVDYKTDRLEPGDTPGAAVARAYATQRSVYALAALREGAERVEVAHCYLERPAEPACAVFTRADVPRLAEELLGLAQGVLTERYPVTERPHRELCGTCPGRPALCSHPEDRTLRPADYLSAGTFSGSGGPS